MAAEDHLRLSDQPVGDVQGLVVLLRTGEVFSLQVLQAQEEVAEGGEQKPAAVNPVGITLRLPCDRSTCRESGSVCDAEEGMIRDM